MQLDRLRPTIYQITLHTYELAALMTAARWVADGAEGELPSEAKNQLAQILDTYDKETKQFVKQE